MADSILVHFFILICQFLSVKSAVNSCSECLILTPYIKNGSADLARNLSSVDPQMFKGIKSHAGFLTVKDMYNSNLFFWLLPVEEMGKKPWVVWLEGGPGITSMMGLFDLLGPFVVEKDKVELRNVTWTSDYSVLFVDNPVGTGFSYTDDERGYPDNEVDVGEQLHEFLLQFLRIFPELREAPLFLAGQSYAGKYVPALGMQIHRNRDKFPINFKGISIGNGLIHPLTTIHYAELCEVLGVLGRGELKQLRQIEASLIDAIKEGRKVDASNKFNETIEYIKKHSGVSVYNFLHDGSNITKPAYEDFLNKPEVRRTIHVGNATFDFNNQVVYNKMLPDIMDSTKNWVEELLEHYGVLLYSGQLDIILAYSLSRHLHDALQWSHRAEFDAAPTVKLCRNNSSSIASYLKYGGNFMEVVVRNAGHSVIGEQPEAAKAMFDRFVQRRTK